MSMSWYLFLCAGSFKSEEEKVNEVMAASLALHTLCDYGSGSSDEDIDVHDVEESSAMQKGNTTFLYLAIMTS